MSSGNTEEPSMIGNYGATELWNIALKIDQVLGLLPCVDIVEVDVFVAPFEVVNNPLVS